MSDPSIDPRQRRQRRQAIAQRLAIVRSIIAEKEVAGALLAARRNFAWLTGGGENHVATSTELGAAPLLVTAAQAVVLAPINEAARIRNEELDLDQEGEGVDPVRSRAQATEIAVQSVDWFEKPDRIALEIAGGEVLDDDSLEERLWPHRSLLEALEHERLAWLGGLLRGALDEVLAAVQAGDTEAQCAARVAEPLGARRIRLPVLLAAADDRIPRYRHPLPTERPVEHRIMLVAVAERWGLHVAATRFRELDQPDTELRGRIDAVREVELAMHQATRSGSTLGAVFATAVAAYEAHGFHDEWRSHHQGGIIGYRARERIAVPGDDTPILGGMAFAWNPSVPGAKAEDTFLLGPRDERSVVT